MVVPAQVPMFAIVHLALVAEIAAAVCSAYRAFAHELSNKFCRVCVTGASVC